MQNTETPDKSRSEYKKQKRLESCVYLKEGSSIVERSALFISIDYRNKSRDDCRPRNHLV